MSLDIFIIMSIRLLVLLVLLVLLMLVISSSGCSSGTGKAWARYVDACAAHIEAGQQICTKFPLPPGGKDRAELIGAIIGAAQDVGEIAAPLVLPALGAKTLSE